MPSGIAGDFLTVSPAIGAVSFCLMGLFLARFLGARIDESDTENRAPLFTEDDTALVLFDARHFGFVIFMSFWLFVSALFLLFDHTLLFREKLLVVFGLLAVVLVALENLFFQKKRIVTFDKRTRTILVVAKGLLGIKTRSLSFTSVRAVSLERRTNVTRYGRLLLSYLALVLEDNSLVSLENSRWRSHGYEDERRVGAKISELLQVPFREEDDSATSPLDTSGLLDQEFEQAKT